MWKVSLTSNPTHSLNMKCYTIKDWCTKSLIHSWYIWFNQGNYYFISELIIDICSICKHYWKEKVGGETYFGEKRLKRAYPERLYLVPILFLLLCIYCVFWEEQIPPWWFPLVWSLKAFGTAVAISGALSSWINSSGIC